VLPVGNGSRSSLLGFSTFGQRLRAARLQRKMSLRQLSAAAELSFSQISRLERQLHAVRAEDAERLARALGTTLHELARESVPYALPLPFVPGATQSQAATYPVTRLTCLENGRRMNLSRIARAGPEWTAVIVRGKLRLTAPGLQLVASARAKLNRKLLLSQTVHAEALETSELLWVEQDPPAPTRPRDYTEYQRITPVLTGSMVGYFATRHATEVDGLETALREAGCISIRHDVIESHSLARPQLREVVEGLRPTATLVAPSLEALGLRTHEVLELIAGVDELGARFATLDGELDTKRPGTTEAIRSLRKLEPNPRSSRVSAGMLAAGGMAVRDKRMGRPPALTAAQADELRALVEAGLSTREIRERLGFTKSTVERYVRRIREGVL
jgi:DNA invertase Pin-like site-specific DNA recombinase/DNA-binding Xre family transcriptional regulator